MAQYLITQSIPLDRGEQFGQIYLKIWKKFPPYIEVLGNSPYITTTDQGKFKVYTLIKISDADTGGGLKEISNFFNIYDEVEGHEWKIETLIKRREALKLVGLSLVDFED
jgi:hypothetical protein